MNQAILGLGSNIEADKNISNARSALKERFNIEKESRFIQTKPVGLLDQPDFINGAVLLRTELDQKSFDSELKKLETELGRRPSTIKFGPRVIDLDILTWNGEIIDQDVYDREFLKNSILELIPELENELNQKNPR